MSDDMATYMLGNVRVFKQHRNDFMDVFGVTLKNFWLGNLFGFDVVAFDEFISPPDGISTYEHALEDYGVEAVLIIRDLVDPDHVTEPGENEIKYRLEVHNEKFPAIYDACQKWYDSGKPRGETIHRSNETWSAHMVSSYDFKAAKIIWEMLGWVPVDDDGITQGVFQEFPIGTQREKIWKWIEDKYGVSIAKLMYK